MRRYRILLMTHELLVPPETIEGLTEEQVDLVRTEYNVYESLRLLGHHVRTIGIGNQLLTLAETIKDWKPHIVFNLLEEFAGHPRLRPLRRRLPRVDPPALHGL